MSQILDSVSLLRKKVDTHQTQEVPYQLPVKENKRTVFPTPCRQVVEKGMNFGIIQRNGDERKGQEKSKETEGLR